jgi:Ca2+-binding EF-hand superfamily protein
MLDSFDYPNLASAIKKIDNALNNMKSQFILIDDMKLGEIDNKYLKVHIKKLNDMLIDKDKVNEAEIDALIGYVDSSSIGKFNIDKTIEK